MLKRLCTKKLSNAFLSLYLTSCSNIGMCYEWVSAVGAGRGTSVWSECIVPYKCNVKERNPALERVH